jgi:hypothetical protein
VAEKPINRDGRTLISHYETRDRERNYLGQGSPGREMTPPDEVGKYFNIRMAVIEMRPKETKAEAWSRHLAEHPEDAYVNLKVFNRSL